MEDARSLIMGVMVYDILESSSTRFILSMSSLVSNFYILSWLLWKCWSMQPIFPQTNALQAG